MRDRRGHEQHRILVFRSNYSQRKPRAHVHRTRVQGLPSTAPVKSSDQRLVTVYMYGIFIALGRGWDPVPRPSALGTGHVYRLGDTSSPSGYGYFGVSAVSSTPRRRRPRINRAAPR